MAWLLSIDKQGFLSTNVLIARILFFPCNFVGFDDPKTSIYHYRATLIKIADKNVQRTPYGDGKPYQNYFKLWIDFAFQHIQMTILDLWVVFQRWDKKDTFSDDMGLLPDTQNCGLRMRRECREIFPRHRGLAIPTCITALAWRTCHAGIAN